MAPRLRFAPLATAARPAPRLLIRRIRTYSTTKQPSTTTQFYKTFTRPIAKVMLLAVFTYQVAYWGWAKMEADEARTETDATIADLEATVGEYQKRSAAGK